MKKFICSLLFALTLAASFSSCTDENVAPKTNEGGTGGTSVDPKS
jgi:hypothetical protein